MSIFRLLLFAAGGLAVLAGTAVAVACSSSFQTWYVQRRLAGHPELGVGVGTVSAGWRRVELQNWRIVQEGGTLTLPAVEVELPVVTAGMGGAVEIRRLVAHGWVLELAPARKAAAAVRGVGGGPAGGGDQSRAAASAPPAVAPAAGVREAFAGVLAGWTSPVDVSLDGADLAGTVVLPEGRGRVAVRITGGGFRAAAEGRLRVEAEAALHDPRVSAVGVQATLAGRMPTPRELAELRWDFAATAQGAQFPGGVGLAGEVAVARGRERETYAVRLSTRTHEILDLAAELPAGAGRVTGTWKLNMRDDDVGPFALGVPLPRFAAAGDGRFDFELARAGLQASGRLTATAGGLEVFRPELAALGEVKFHGDFDLAERDGVYAVRRLVAGLATTGPVATVTALQPFEFNPASGAVRPTDATRELVGVKLHGLPVAWARPFLGEFAFSGGDLQGELTGLARSGGVVLRTIGNVTIADASLARGAQRWVEGVDLSFASALDYNPQGWQAEIHGLSVRQGGKVLLALDARAGQLSGKEEAVKTTGRFEADLATFLAQPFATGLTGLTSGQAAVQFAGSLGKTKELYAKVDLKKLQSGTQGQPVALPDLAADVRVDLEAEGKVAFRVPVTLEAGTRQSDFSIVGTKAPNQGGPGRFEATVTGARLVVADVRLLGAAFLPAPAAQPPSAVAAPTAPARAGAPWAGMAGSVSLKLGQVEWGEASRASEVSGRIELEAGKMKLDGIQAGWGENGHASFSGVLAIAGDGPQPYQLDGTVALKEIELAPFFPAAPGQSRPALDGRFELTGQVTSRASDFDELMAGVGGEFRFRSKGGVFRGLPAMVNQTVANTGRVAGFIAAAGSALGGLTGRREPAAVAGRAQAVAEFATAISAIAFDQLSFGFTRDAARNGVVRDFALIAPELRLTGGGSLLHRPGTSAGADSLAMEFKLTARGRQAELLRYLGVLDSFADGLGYASCSLPIRLGGTFARPDASDLSTRLAALALEKSGVTEKASELFNRIIGGGK